LFVKGKISFKFFQFQSSKTQGSTHIIEKPVIELSVQERWALYFEYLTNIKYRNTINEIIKYEEGITMATKALMRITRSDREWAYRESKLKYELDRQSLIYETKREGVAEGRKEGISQGELNKALDIARNMKNKGRPLAQIEEDTGLSLEEINNL
jgi:predicted transposase/invertase (TIGR01784 family)